MKGNEISFREINPEDMNRITYLYKEIKNSDENFIRRQNNLYENLKKNYSTLIDLIRLVFLYQSSSQKNPQKLFLLLNRIYFPFFSNIFQPLSININNNYTNYSNHNSFHNNFLSKKTLRKESIKEAKNKNVLNKDKDNKIFLITKIRNKEEEKKLITRKKFRYRGSKYRGVTKNGKTWQVLIMINRSKKYFGHFRSEIEAAHAYDDLAMKFHKDKARLNFFHQGYIKHVNEVFDDKNIKISK